MLRAEHAVLYPEKMQLSELTLRLAPLWPGLELKLNNDVDIKGDRRALESILKNIIQNAYHHGEASLINISGTSADKNICITLQDNGRGFSGKQERLGEAFFRHNGRSGSGIGLFFSKNLLKRMNGNLEIPAQSKTGFLIKLNLKAAQ